jgi:hypothetical protein
MAKIDPKQEMEDARRILVSAVDGSGKRLAVRKWLQGAMVKALEDQHSIAAATELVKAFEMLDAGRIHEIFRLPEGQKSGGKSKSAAEVAKQGFALAAVEALRATGFKKSQALELIEEDLEMKRGSLRDLEKKMRRERAKPERSRKQYQALESIVEEEKGRLETQMKGDDAQERLFLPLKNNETCSGSMAAGSGPTREPCSPTMESGSK